MAMRSARRIASSKSWVMKTMVFFSDRLEAQELVLHLAPDQRVERREGLVEEPELRLDRQRRGRCRRAAAGRPTAGAGSASSRPARPTSSIISRARASRSRAGHALHLEREGDVLQHRQVRQQREVLEHHAHLVAADLDHLARRTRPAGSAPSNRISPAVGSTSRDRQRTSVDLPEPDSPMMTKISPSRTVEVGRRAPRRRGPPRGSSTESRVRASGRAAVSAACGPNSFQTPRQASLTGFAPRVHRARPDRGRPSGAAAGCRRVTADPGLPAGLVRGHPVGDHLVDRLAVRGRPRRSSRPSSSLSMLKALIAS